MPKKDEMMDLAQFQAQMGTSTVVSTVEAIYATGHWLLAREQFADAAKVFRVMLHAAPRDERGWLALGECHERVGQPRIALELYGSGSVAANPSPKCHLARALVLRGLDQDDEAADAFDRATQLATELDNEEVLGLVLRDRDHGVRS